VEAVLETGETLDKSAIEEALGAAQVLARIADVDWGRIEFEVRDSKVRFLTVARTVHFDDVARSPAEFDKGDRIVTYQKVEEIGKGGTGRELPGQ
jgi:hypothetical protein